jgi:hypothetical protein
MRPRPALEADAEVDPMNRTLRPDNGRLAARPRPRFRSASASLVAGVMMSGQLCAM